MTSLLHHVSTHDHPVDDHQLGTSLLMVDLTRRALSDCTRAYDMPTDERGIRSVGLRCPGNLEIVHDEMPSTISTDPTRRVHLIDRRHGRNTLFIIDSCMKPYGSIREENQETGVAEILDLVECALRTAPLTPGRMSRRLQTVMDGIAWIHNTPDEEADRMGMPWIWLAPSPVRGMRLNAIERPFDLHAPHMCCLSIRETGDRLIVKLSVLAGHTFDKRMTAVDGMRAVRELEEWRAEDLGRPHSLAA